MKIVIGIIILISLIYCFNRKGASHRLKFPIIKWGFTHRHNLSEAKQSYILYNGIDKYPFTLTKGRNLTLHYKVTNQKGLLTMKVIDGNNIIYDENFTNDSEGSFTYIPKNQTQIVTFIGSYAKGSCEVKITKNDEEIKNS